MKEKRSFKPDNRPEAPEEGLFIGRNAVSELLKSGREIDKIYMRSEADGVLLSIRAKALERKIPIIESDIRRLDKMACGGVHQGVIAVAAETDYLSVDELLSLVAEKGEKPFFLICDSINDPHNLGALIRSANCAGVNGVIIPKRRAVGVNGTVAKSSAGAVFAMPIARVPNLASAVKTLKENGVWIWAVEAGGKPYYDHDYKGSCALILGSEGEGVSDLLKKESDFIAGIPMFGSVNSLNVSAAGAIVMFEAAKQRNN
ncbi:MAG: 23S rRNA (guanosine(2251)-2'-O)-methyltransferase RlmB [Clostridia bacterium]|nr:23S rRNA (guanosine(2251)-2'-O)-methyltransferase RlmB [Clostridia bacterium]